MPGSFADTNILLYLFSKDLEKRGRARELSRAGYIISTQVLNEMASVLRSKWDRSWSETREILDEVYVIAQVRALDRATHDLGLKMAERYQIHIYDGMIVAAALLADCDTLYSEDMHAGLLVEGRLRIVNPFRAS